MMNAMAPERLAGLWAAVALLFGGLLGLAEWSRNRLDDPDPAYQRSGTLMAERTWKAPPVLPGFPRGGRRLAVIFARSVEGQMLFHDLALQSDLSALADIVLVVADGRPPTIRRGLNAIVPDGDGALAHAYGLRTPRDGGYPVGYVLVDSEGYIRHQTLDPHCLGVGHNQEIKALVKAMP